VKAQRLLGSMLSVVGDFELGWWDVAAVFVEPWEVEPVDPFGGREVDSVHGPPRHWGFDQLGFVEPLTVSARALSYES